MLLDLFRQEESDPDFDLLEAVVDLATREGWEGIIRDALAILADFDQQETWYRAAAVLFWAGDAIPEPKMAVVARLYRCLVIGPDFGEAENLVWTIAKDLKGVGYLSEWDPMRDPEVQGYMDAME